jgi:phosphate acetyltransferase
MIAKGQSNELLNAILTKYKRLESQCDFVLCEGTDYTGVSSALEFDFNADVASNLGCPVMIVVNGSGKAPDLLADAVRVARKALEARNCTVAAACVNRIAASQMEAVAMPSRRTKPAASEGSSPAGRCEPRKAHRRGYRDRAGSDSF